MIEFKKQSKTNVSPKLKAKLNFKCVKTNTTPILRLLVLGHYSAEVAHMLRDAIYLLQFLALVNKNNRISRDDSASKLSNTGDEY